MGFFQDSLKKWFYTKNSSAASSDARVPLLDASGNPKGSDTMANLASILGGYPAQQTMQYVTSGSCNDLIPSADSKYKIYRVACNNMPTGIAGGYVISFTWNADFVSQFFVDADHAKLFARAMYRETWESWQTVALDIPSFYKNYNNIGLLSSDAYNNLPTKEIASNSSTTFTIDYIRKTFIIIGSTYYGSVLVALSQLNTNATEVGGNTTLSTMGVVITKSASSSTVTITNNGQNKVLLSYL